MPRTKISKVARALNIGLQTAVDFLDKKGISVDTNPNTKIDESAVMLLVKEYAPQPTQRPPLPTSWQDPPVRLNSRPRHRRPQPLLLQLLPSRHPLPPPLPLPLPPHPRPLLSAVCAFSAISTLTAKETPYASRRLKTRTQTGA